MSNCLKSSFFKANYAKIFEGDLSWKKIKAKKSPIFKWSMNSTYIKKPPFLEKEKLKKYKRSQTTFNFRRLYNN